MFPGYTDNIANVTTLFYNSILHFSCVLWFSKCLWIYVGFCSLNSPLWPCGPHFINLNTHAWRRMWCMNGGTAPGTCRGTQHFLAHKTCLQRACLAPDHDSPTLFWPHSIATKHCPLGLVDFYTCYCTEAWFCSTHTCYDYTKCYRVVKLVERNVSFKKLTKSCFWQRTCYFLHICKFNLKCFKLIIWCHLSTDGQVEIAIP